MSTTENSLSTFVVADEDEDKEAYVVKHPDLNLLDQVSEQMLDRLLNDKKLRPIDKREGHIVLGGIQGIGEAGEKFHNMSDTEQNSLLAQMYYTSNLAQTNETFMVALELKPAQPSMPTVGPQFAPMGPGGMGGMSGPRPPSPQGMPHFQPHQQQVPPGYMPPGYPPAWPPQQGAQPYSPQGDPYAQQNHGNAYAQPHAYPSYPAQPHPGHYGHPPQGAPGWPPQQPYPPQGAPPGYPPYPPQGWPQQQSPAQPVIIEAETDEKKDTPSTDGSDR